MVAKPSTNRVKAWCSLNLAKIHMVAKRDGTLVYDDGGLNLAKIHMVAKP